MIETIKHSQVQTTDGNVEVDQAYNYFEFPNGAPRQHARVKVLSIKQSSFSVDIKLIVVESEPNFFRVDFSWTWHLSKSQANNPKPQSVLLDASIFI